MQAGQGFSVLASLSPLSIRPASADACVRGAPPRARCAANSCLPAAVSARRCDAQSRCVGEALERAGVLHAVDGAGEGGAVDGKPGRRARRWCSRCARRGRGEGAPLRHAQAELHAACASSRSRAPITWVSQKKTWRSSSKLAAASSTYSALGAFATIGWSLPGEQGRARSSLSRAPSAAGGGGADLGADGRSQIRAHDGRQFDVAGFRNVLSLRAEIEGSIWGGKPPSPDRYLDLSYYEKARPSGGCTGTKPCSAAGYRISLRLLAVCAALGLRAGARSVARRARPLHHPVRRRHRGGLVRRRGPALLAAGRAGSAASCCSSSRAAAITFRGTAQVIEILAYALSTLLIGALGGAMQRARRRAEENEQRFRAFMQNSPSGVFLKDEAGRYVFISRAGEQLIGRTDWLGRTDDELLPQAPPARSCASATARCCRRSAPRSSTSRCRRRRASARCAA